MSKYSKKLPIKCPKDQDDITELLYKLSCLYIQPTGSTRDTEIQVVISHSLETITRNRSTFNPSFSVLLIN